MSRILKCLALSLAALALTVSLGPAPALAEDSEDAAPTRWLKLRVYENEATTPNVVVNVPLRLVSALLRIAACTGALDATIDLDVTGVDEAESPLKLRGKDLAALWKEIEAMDPGRIVQVRDGNERVEIWIE